MLPIIRLPVMLPLFVNLGVTSSRLSADCRRVLQRACLDIARLRRVYALWGAPRLLLRVYLQSYLLDSHLPEGKNMTVKLRRTPS